MVYRFVDRVCPKCNGKHEAVSGMYNEYGDYLVQRHCIDCHYTEVTNEDTGVKREGTLPEEYLIWR